ncbi:MAG: alpha/beta hydrolase [bacterium]
MRAFRQLAAVVGGVWLAAGAAAMGVQPSAAPQELPLREAAKAKPGVVYQTTVRVRTNQPDAPGEEPLRLTWTVPDGFTMAEPRPLVFILHGDEHDYRWGHRAYPPTAAGELAPGCMVVSIDGPTEPGDGTRIFAARPADVVAFRDAMLEVARQLPSQRIILFGSAEGGLFASALANGFPRVIDGVVLHGAGLHEVAFFQGRLGGIRSVPVALVHGADDPAMPITQSFDGMAVLRTGPHAMAAFMPLPGVDDRPVPAEATQAIDFCIGMSAGVPADALAAARRLATPQRGAPAALGLARRVLKRFDPPAEQPELPGPNQPEPTLPPTVRPAGRMLRPGEVVARPMETPTPEQRAEAFALAVEIEKVGLAVAGLLERTAPDANALGRLLAADTGWPQRVQAGAGLLWLRTQFAGIEAVDGGAQRTGFEDRLEEHREAADEFHTAWFGENLTASQQLSLLREHLGRLWLLPGFPEDVGQWTERWAGEPSRFGLADAAQVNSVRDQVRAIKAGHAAAAIAAAEQRRSGQGLPTWAGPPGAK